MADINASNTDKTWVHQMTNEIEELEEIRFVDLAPAIEFICWVVVVLAPLLRLVNGPAVTNDQWWIQVFIFSSALAGGCSMRLYQVRTRRKSE